MNTEHTPGPWDVELGDLGLEISSANTSVASAWGEGKEATANAHLIAAAPDLLNALLIAVNQLRMMSIASSEEGNESLDWAAYSSSHEMKQIRAALDKATQTI